MRTSYDLLFHQISSLHNVCLCFAFLGYLLFESYQQPFSKQKMICLLELVYPTVVEKRGEPSCAIFFLAAFHRAFPNPFVIIYPFLNCTLLIICIEPSYIGSPIEPSYIGFSHSSHPFFHLTSNSHKQLIFVDEKKKKKQLTPQHKTLICT